MFIGLPVLRCSPMPLSRTVAPYFSTPMPPSISGRSLGSSGIVLFHTGYEPSRAASQGDQASDPSRRDLPDADRLEGRDGERRDVVGERDPFEAGIDLERMRLVVPVQQVRLAPNTDRRVLGRVVVGEDRADAAFRLLGHLSPGGAAGEGSP